MFYLPDSYYDPPEAREFEEEVDVEHECTPDLDDDDPAFRFFEGTVVAEAWHWPGSSAYGFRWTCPLCGTESEGERDLADWVD